MNAEYYPFQLGDFDCYALSDGRFNYPLDVLFATAPEEELNRVLRQQEVSEPYLTTTYTCLLINTGAQRVLVDTGAGRGAQHAGDLFPTIDHSAALTGRIVPNMRAVGFEPQDIDIVVLTHAHPDHVGGNLDAAGKVRYPNARFVIDQTELAFWMSDAAAEKVSPALLRIARENLEPLGEQLEQVAGRVELAPGIEVVPTPGHTPGHLALSVRSGDQHLLHLSDVALHPWHLENPHWRPALDIDQEQAAATRRSVLDRAAEEQTLLFIHHFGPFPALGQVRKQGNGWCWQPLAVQ
jgi:glyoxylase-like metal-dependent hydrolase (beta-lactamase superfamily II)